MDGRDGADGISVVGRDGQPGRDGKDGKDGVPGLVFCGDWKRGKYPKGSVVCADGSSYVAIVDGVSIEPPGAGGQCFAARASAGPRATRAAPAIRGLVATLPQAPQALTVGEVVFPSTDNFRVETAGDN